MRRGASSFVSLTPRITRRYLPTSEHEGTRAGSHFVREVPVRAGFHACGLGRAPEAFDPRPSSPLSAEAPLRAGHYVGVIEEVGADGVIHAALRETPNGRELIVALARDEETWSGPTTPEPGDDIEVYTWTELHRVPDGSASPIEKMRVDVLRRQLTPEDRAAIDRAIKVLERGSDGRDGGDDAR